MGADRIIHFTNRAQGRSRSRVRECADPVARIGVSLSQLNTARVEFRGSQEAHLIITTLSQELDFIGTKAYFYCLSTKIFLSI
jgi:hypothetical protein